MPPGIVARMTPDYLEPSRAEHRDVASIAEYLMDAVADRSITIADAERAVLEWTHDRDVLAAASRACRPGTDAPVLLLRACSHCHEAA